jgi:lipopolysaccharide biosynthesis regulator YciM
MVNNIYDVNMIETMLPFFDHTEKLFQKHFQEMENAILLRRDADQVPEEEREWRSEIEKGEELDCLKVDNEFYDAR